MRTNTFVSAPALLCGLVCSATALTPTQATVYTFTLDSPNSSAAMSSNVSSPVAGTFKGNYDEVNNPTGTMTRPGLFGGSGNIPIPYTGTVSGGGNAQTNPAGEFRLDVDTAASSVVMSALSADMLNGASPSFPAMFTVLYQTFRTFQPNSTFIGGIALPIPLGNLVVDSLTVTQTSDSLPGVLTATGKSQYDYSVVVEATISYTGTFGGSPVGGEYPAALVITGTLTIAENYATATTAIDWSIDETDTGPFEPFVDLPLDVPTILPPGFTAHLLMSGTIQSITTQLSLDADLSSNGVRVHPGDVNGDFVVNVSDLLAVINGWGACPAPPTACPGDVFPFLNGDGVVNVSDLLFVINNWG